MRGAACLSLDARHMIAWRFVVDDDGVGSKAVAAHEPLHERDGGMVLRLCWLPIVKGGMGWIKV